MKGSVYICADYADFEVEAEVDLTAAGSALSAVRAYRLDYPDCRERVPVSAEALASIFGAKAWGVIETMIRHDAENEAAS